MLQGMLLTIALVATSQPGKAPPSANAPFDAAQAKAHQEAWAKHVGTKVETENSVGAKMILIPPGEFLMGSDAGGEEALKIEISWDEKQYIRRSQQPQHRVVITKPFLMSATEVTIGQFQKFTAATGYRTGAEKLAEPKTFRNPGYPVTDDSPAACIAWNDAGHYCNWLSQQEKTTYRLPTEAEWEFACRAGTTSQYSFGDDANQLEQFGWYNEIAGHRSQPVGTKPANAFGLHDMHGNVWEWCRDFYDNRTRYDDFPTLTGDSGTPRAIRGGAWVNPATRCRSAHRVARPPSLPSFSYGFRCVREW